MADDDDYAQKIMGKVDDAVGILKDISEKDLGEGVNFAQLSVSIDEEGNMKFFAQLEKLSEEQAARLEAAKERRAEEEKAADNPLNPNGKEEQSALTEIIFQRADVEASSRDELPVSTGRESQRKQPILIFINLPHEFYFIKPRQQALIICKT